MGEDTTAGAKMLSSEEEYRQRYPYTESSNSVVQWKEAAENNTMGESLKILDPEDPLMKRFQDALKAHLTRVDRKLAEDIADLDNEAKVAKKLRDTKAAELYRAQNEIARQQEILDKYQSKLVELMGIREEKDGRLSEAKELKKLAKEDLDREKSIAERNSLGVENLAAMSRRFAEWEEEIASHLTVSKRMTAKDASVQRKLLQKKQQEDYILAKLMEEVARLEREIKDCREQLAIKDQERQDVQQTIADANADLDELQGKQKKLFGQWNLVVASITQRDKVNDELSSERTKMRETFTTLGSQIEKLKKDTSKEMEKNERLTSVQTRIEDDIRYNLGIIASDKEKVENLECQLMKMSKLSEETQKQFDNACWDYQRCVDDEKVVDKQLEKLANEKVEIEDEILSKLENKLTNDKAVKSMNKTLREDREKMREQELVMLQTENSYGKLILELEKLNSFIATEKYDVDDLIKMNIEREKKLDATQNELKKCDLFIEKKQQKILSLNKKIEEKIALSATGEEVTPQDLRITELEKNIEETETNNRKAQELWLRREGYMVTLSEQRTSQLEELSLLGKQITLMEQKNLKLEHEIERQRREDEAICRRIKLLQQKLIAANERLAIQREVRDDLEDKNCITKGECIEALREAEIELLKLQNDIKQLMSDRVSLEEQLRAAQRESLSWEKKVQLAAETAKDLKEERCSGGDVATMKSEIHRMEMRLLHLRKAQEKMIRDMEFCVARRDIIIDGAMAREKRNPKGQHNQRVLFEKRMNDQKLKIKQMTRESKQTESEILELESQQKALLEQLDENQKTLRAYVDALPDIDKQITEGEFIKYHKLECLVRKQRKVRMLQDVKDGKYKMLFKSELSLNDELQKQRTISVDLKEVMEETRRDFPLLKDDIRKILLSMEAS